MAVTNAAAEPELHDFDTCRSCGAEIAWVDVQPGGRRRPVDPAPMALAEYVLLRDGVTVVNDRDERVTEQLDAYTGPRFWDHVRTCTTPSMRTVRAAIAQSLDLAERVLYRAESMSFGSTEQHRNAQRRLLQTARL